MNKKRDKHKPPSWPDKLLEKFCASELTEEILGDLHERFAKRVQKLGERKAKWHYIREVLSYIRFSNIKTASSEDKNIILMSILNNYIKVASRNLLRHKVFSFINITGLSIGLACCMLIILYTKDEVSFDQFHVKKDQIYRVTATISNEDNQIKLGSTNLIVGPSFQEEIPEVKSFVRMQSGSYIIKKGNESFDQRVVFTDDNFFEAFTFPLIHGDKSNVFAELQSVVLTEKSAEKYFGKTDVVGESLELRVGDSFEPFVVTGVAKNPPQNSSVQFEMMLPFKFSLTQYKYIDNSWLGFYIHTFLILDEKADYNQVLPKLDQVFLSKAKDELAESKEKFEREEQIHFGMQPFTQIHLDTEFGDVRNGLTSGSNPIYSYILSGIALFIMLIACINFINLTVAHSLKRAKEIGIRKVIGGQRAQLIGQFLGESFTLCLFAFVAALFIVEISLPSFNELANKQLSFSYLLDTQLVVGYIVLFFITGLSAGFYPAIVLSGFKPVQALSNRVRLSSKNYLAKALVVLQFALATFLIIGTVGIYAQFDYLTHKDLGYNDEDLVMVGLERGKEAELAAQFKNELVDKTTIQSVSLVSPGNSYTSAKTDGTERGFFIKWIDENYLPTLQVPIVAGRNFTEGNQNEEDESVLVNEAFAKEAGWENPIGKQVDFFYNNEKLTVIGLVKDYHFSSLKEKIGPLLYKKGAGSLVIKLKHDRIIDGLITIEDAYKKILPFRPFQYDFKNTENERNYEAEAKWKQMITAGALLSILISCMGLFGLAMLSIQRRTKEVGIRKVLGAKVTDIVALITSDFIKLVIIAFVIAIPAGAYAINYWLEDFAYRIELQWWLFAIPGVLALLVATLTIGFQSIKAAIANPIDSLRNE
ncbi:ABC transporter permease [Chondrinema litorale]|uniref:ABC transporter permease n=1 Tax=Chondrinema litorale TaxID=2994555 RepID=UPI002542F23E|nr:ABC transporter permease [Chondrinema litorale]UZR97653.1 ABC transporter permease [Chondrinema litorale]